MASQLKDMKNLPSMKVTKKAEPMKEPSEYKEPEYPYGLRISLNKDSLAKLKLSTKDFKIKDKVMIMAEAEVCEIRASASEYNDSENVELKITNMTCAPKKMRRS